MIKFAGTKDGKPFLGIGLSQGNWDKLLAHKPIVVDLDPLGLPWKGSIIIMGGPTELAMTVELERLGVLEGTKINIDPKLLDDAFDPKPPGDAT